MSLEAKQQNEIQSKPSGEDGPVDISEQFNDSDDSSQYDKGLSEGRDRLEVEGDSQGNDSIENQVRELDLVKEGSEGNGGTGTSLEKQIAAMTEEDQGCTNQAMNIQLNADHKLIP